MAEHGDETQASRAEPATIQPHGCMLVCTMPGWIIVAMSGNCGLLLGQESAPLLGRPLDDVLPHQLVHDLRNVLQTAMGSGRTEHLLDVCLDDVGRFDLALHIAGQHAIIELVPRRAEDAAGQHSGLLIRSMTGRLVRAPSLERCLTLAANQARAVTGFDRVIISKLSDDGTGQVIAEAVRTGLPPFLGVRYRISDLPAADQALFRRSGLRFVPDTEYDPVPVLCSGADVDLPDLSLAVLRGVEVGRLSDLRSLGARAVLTIPLVDRDRLWGLMSCQHSAPRPLPTSIATTLDLFGQILSMQIALKDASSGRRGAAATQAAIDELAEHWRLAADAPSAFATLASALRELIPCDGVGLWYAGAWLGNGLTPPPDALNALLDAFRQAGPDVAVVARDAPSEDSPREAGGVCGSLIVRLLRHRPDALMFFRGETVETLVWGLDPDRQRAPGPGDGATLPASEHRSDVRRGRSLAWQAKELQTAERIRIALLEALLDRAERQC